ncbi:MAG: hypothetical protein ABJA84_06605 [Polaromonas sp.]
MPEHKNSSRRTYASAPVNRRTTPRAAAKPPPLPAAVRARAQKTQQRQWLGAPLSELAGRPQRHRLHPGVIAATVFAVAAASALLLLRSATGLALAAAFCALGGASWLWQNRRQRSDPGALNRPASPALFDAQALRTIDEAFEATAAVVNEPALAALISLKAAAARMALAVGRAEVNGDFTHEDRLYVIECIRRYIPDTLSAYLQVPPAQRALPGPQAAASADHLLQGQLALLQAELEQREQRLHESAVEPLLRQQRFLQSKARRG